MRDKAKATTDH